jgi:uncharacterized membrane protein
MTYFLLKFFHIIGAAVLLGTGAGIAFFMLMAHRSRDAGFIARTAGIVLPVVWMQIRMRDLARAAALAGEPLPGAYRRLFRCWFAFGFPAFGSVLAIIWLMITKPF